MKFSKAKHRRTALTLAIASGSLLALPSCNIPSLRGPQAQATLPSAYPAGNNGVVDIKNDDGDKYDVPISPADETLKPDGMTTQAGDHPATRIQPPGSVSFASFLKSSGELDIKDDGTAAELSTDAPEPVPDDSYLSTGTGDMVSVSVAEAINPIDGIINLNRASNGAASGVATGSNGGATSEEVMDAIDAAENSSSLDAGIADGAAGPNAAAESNAAAMDSDATASELEFDATSMDFGPARPQNAALMGWHDFFDDPDLSALIAQAMTGNQELKILAENIQIANNQVLARSGAYRPFLSFGAGAGVEKPSLFTPLGAAERQLDPIPGVGFPDPRPEFLIAADLSWQIDIWNQLHNAQYAACLRYLGTRDGWNYVVTRMVSEVAENYYELLALDSEMSTLDATIGLQEQSLETSKAMMAQARGNQLAVQRFQAEVRKNQSQKLIIQQQIVEAENRINFLLGRYPQPVKRSEVNYIDLNLQALNVGVPSDLLRNRSDVRQAERELRAAGLDIKVARANFYPALTLTGGIGYEAFNPKYLFRTPESLIYSLAGGLVAPLVNKRAIQAEYKDANARQLQAVYDYQRTILQAYTEVTNYMTKVENYRKSIVDKKQQLEALVASIESANALFQNARGEYLDVLLAQRDMNEAKMELIETKQEQLTAIVDAYQALGGGGVLAGYQ